MVQCGDGCHPRSDGRKRTSSSSSRWSKGALRRIQTVRHDATALCPRSNFCLLYRLPSLEPGLQFPQHDMPPRPMPLLISAALPDPFQIADERAAPDDANAGRRQLKRRASLDGGVFFPRHWNLTQNAPGLHLGRVFLARDCKLIRGRRVVMDAGGPSRQCSLPRLGGLLQHVSRSAAASPTRLASLAGL